MSQYIFDDIATVKQAASLPRLASKYTKLRKSGDSYVAKCCFHEEKTPSLRVHEKYFKCFGCGVGGDVFTFVKMAERVTFPEALKIVADEFNVPLDGKPTAKSATERRRRRIMAPILDKRDKMIADLRYRRGIKWSQANEIDRVATEIGRADDKATWLLVKDAADRRFDGDVMNEEMLELEAMPDMEFIRMMDRAKLGI